MADNIVRNIAPFIDDRFLITSPWWNVRINPITGKKQIHRGLDIATSGKKPVYSMLTGIVHSKGYDGSQGNWIVITDHRPESPVFGYATLYMHLDQPSPLNVNDTVTQNQQVGLEGTTGASTGVHLHVEMQDIRRFGWTWHWSYTKSDYLDPTVFMGIDNIDDTWWIYDGTPYDPPTPPEPTPSGEKEKKKFPWFIYYNRWRMLGR